MSRLGRTLWLVPAVVMLSSCMHLYRRNTGRSGETKPTLEKDLASAEPSGSRKFRKEVEVSRNQGESLLRVRVELGAHSAQLLLMASPDKDPRHVGIEVSRSRYGPDGDVECDLQVMTENGLVDLPATLQAVRGSKRYMRLKVKRRTLYEMAVSDYVVLRACDQRWPLEPDHMDPVRRFVLALREEIAVREKEGSLSAMGLDAPVQGWPQWATPSKEHPPAAAKKLTAESLFKKLQPSVYTVTAKTITGRSQGSAVAVTSRRLLTNCHILQNAASLTLHSGDFELKAKPIASDPKSDRCVLELFDAEIKPVEGVRAFKDLEVGEKVFALGAPVGLEHTLSEGIISAKRFSGDSAYIQTTAPISPGSSGGGLFDSAGNLIGITTLVVPGRERLNQALNFAIAAESFWNPAKIDPSRNDSDKDKEETRAHRFDPDLHIEVDEVKFRLAGDVNDSRTHLRLLLLRELGSERWNNCKLTLTLTKGKKYATWYRVRKIDKEKVESVELTLPVSQLKAWSSEDRPSIYLCYRRCLRLEGDNLKKVREAIERFEKLAHFGHRNAR